MYVIGWVVAISLAVLGMRVCYLLGKEDGHAEGFDNGERFAKARSYMWDEYQNGKAN